MLATNILKRVENKKEVENDLLSMMAPPIIQSCSTTSSFSELGLLVKRNKLVYSQPNHNHYNHEKMGHKI